MGEPEVKRKNINKNKKYIEENLIKNAKFCISGKNKSAAIRKSLGSLLEEKIEFTDYTGVKRTVQGSKTSTEQNKAGIYGTLEIFELPEFKHQPFDEVSRNMSNHFKMYCLAKGVSDEEMISLAESEPKGALREKLLTLKASFFDMVANKRMSEIEDYYVGIANYIEKKLPKFMSFDTLESLNNYQDDLCLISGSASYLQQTLRLSGYGDARPDQKALIDNVNKKLAAQGKTYTLQNVETGLFPFDVYISSLIKVSAKQYPFQESIDYDKEIAGEVFGINNNDLCTVASVSSCVLNSVKEIKKRAIETGCDYNNTFTDHNSLMDYSERQSVENGAFLYRDVLTEYRLPMKSHQQNYLYLTGKLAESPNLAKAEGDESILGLLSSIAASEQTVNDNADPKPSDYEKIADGYVKLKDLTDKALKDENGQLNDDEIELLHRIRTFADKSLEDPKIGIIAAAKEKYVEVFKQEVDLSQKRNAIFNTLTGILEEKYTHVDSKGITRVISGSKNNKEANTLGITEIFASPEFMGQPFREVSRNMFSHFKMYCLTKGLSEKELLSLAEPEIKPELKTKLLEMKKGFLDMVIEKDNERISDMYVSVFEMLNSDKDRILKLTPGNIKALKDDPAAVLKYSGSQSWYAQTFDHEGSAESEKTKELIGMIDKKLADKGFDFTYNHAALPLNVTESIGEMPSYLSSEYITYDNMSPESPHSAKIMYTNNVIALLQDRYKDFSAENSGKSWLNAFFDKQGDMIQSLADGNMFDRDVFFERASSYDNNSGFKKVFNDKAAKLYAAGPQNAKAPAEADLDKYKAALNKFAKDIESTKGFFTRDSDEFKKLNSYLNSAGDFTKLSNDEFAVAFRRVKELTDDYKAYIKTKPIDNSRRLNRAGIADQISAIYDDFTSGNKNKHVDSIVERDKCFEIIDREISKKNGYDIPALRNAFGRLMVMNVIDSQAHSQNKLGSFDKQAVSEYAERFAETDTISRMIRDIDSLKTLVSEYKENPGLLSTKTETKLADSMLNAMADEKNIDKKLAAERAVQKEEPAVKLNL